jgi:hypothetical protein
VPLLEIGKYCLTIEILNGLRIMILTIEFLKH